MKVWHRMVDDLFKSLGIDKGEWLELSMEIVHQLYFWFV